VGDLPCSRWQVTEDPMRAMITRRDFLKNAIAVVGRTVLTGNNLSAGEADSKIVGWSFDANNPQV